MLNLKIGNHFSTSENSSVVENPSRRSFLKGGLAAILSAGVAPSVCGSITRGIGYRNLAGRMAMFSSQSDKDYGIDCIRNNGRQYIDTGFCNSFDNGFKLTLDFIPASLGKRYCFFSNYNSSNHISWEGSNGNKSRIYVHGDVSINGSYTKTSLNRGEISYYNGVFTNKMNEYEETVSRSFSGVSTSPLLMFVDQEKRFTTFSSLLVKSAQIYDGENLIRDFIAALDTNGEPCLYDLVSKQYFTNAGTSGFIGVRYLDRVTKTGRYIIVAPNLTGLNNSDFINDVNITGSVSLPVCTTIGNSAFSGCSGLNGSVSLPVCTTIGNSAFYGCSGLNGSVSLPVCTTIGSSAFQGCSGIKEVNAPSIINATESIFSGFSMSDGDIYLPALRSQSVGVFSSFMRNVRIHLGVTMATARAGMGAEFPWYAHTSTRFNCTDGYIVYENGVWTDHPN